MEDSDSTPFTPVTNTSTMINRGMAEEDEDPIRRKIKQKSKQ